MSTAPRPLYWSIRRELWENRSLVIAPLVAAFVGLLGYLLSTFRLPARMAEIAALDPALQGHAIARSICIAGFPVLLTAFLVGIVYCLGTLYNERRDRSILFWKSLPVSDLVTVLAKASIPLLVLPVIAFVLVVATEIAVLFIGTAVLLAHDGPADLLWTGLPFVQMTIGLIYSMLVIALWHAPFYAWLLLVSAWARRTPFLWAIAPVALCVVEVIAFHTTHLGRVLLDRLAAQHTGAFVDDGTSFPIDQLSQINPLGFLSNPGLWIGLLVTALLIAATIRLRRGREPI